MSNVFTVLSKLLLTLRCLTSAVLFRPDSEVILNIYNYEMQKPYLLTVHKINKSFNTHYHIQESKPQLPSQHLRKLVGLYLTII